MLITLFLQQARLRLHWKRTNIAAGSILMGSRGGGNDNDDDGDYYNFKKKSTPHDISMTAEESDRRRFSANDFPR